MIFCALVATQTAFAQERRMIVLDGSASMWGTLGGKAKMDLTRGALAEALQGYEGEVGLTAYGSRRPKSCEDIAALVPVAAGAAGAVVAAAKQMKFQGQSPLTEAVRRAATDLRAGGGQPTVVLITDGVESCRADPCALAKTLEAEGSDFTAHVIGLGLSEEQRTKVACLAEDTGGRYIAVADGAGLTRTLRELLGQAAAAPTPEAVTQALQPGDAGLAPRVLLAPGKPLGAEIGLIWEVQQIAPTPRPPETHEKLPAQLAAGRYRVTAVLGLARGSAEVMLEPGKTATPELNLNAAEVTVRPKISGPGDPDTVRIDVILPDGRSTGGTGEAHFFVPAGQVGLRVHLDGSAQRETLTLAAGEAVTHDIVIATGMAAVEIYYTADMRVQELQPKVRIYADGTPAPVAFAQGAEPVFSLSPGDYRAEVELETLTASSPFTVAAAQETVVPVRLEAGLLTVMAPGASRISLEIKEATGARVPADVAGSAAQWVLPAGHYLIAVQLGSEAIRQEAIVASGARTDVILPVSAMR